ncbi:Fc receptor-like protein 1 isoform X3 [Zalophus californianus]|uniref:Fc receptor-like protein 1 isoform X3 n=2 Tax=Otariidae TaxID=9702 RepID=A0A6J2ECR8_ZALCA|nr:Fc receptor-like protein 1 isoform X3 [Zalophus californianus]
MLKCTLSELWTWDRATRRSALCCLGPQRRGNRGGTWEDSRSSISVNVLQHDFLSRLRQPSAKLLPLHAELDSSFQEKVSPVTVPDPVLMLLGLVLLMCAPPCEPASEVLLLTARPSRPKEGSSMTLTCEAQAASWKPDAQPQFCFFRDSQALWQGWSSSPELQLPTVWREDSGSYWCEAKISDLRVARSPRIQIQVQDNDASMVPGRGCGIPPEGVPVWNVSLETRPPGGQVQKGEKLVLVCLATQGTGDITFSWYKGALGLNLETKTQRSLAAKFEIPAVTESDTEKYYCMADNGYGPSISELVSVTVRSPVSFPVLTLRAPGAQAFPGDVVELRCEAQSGSPPILYRFYHEDVTLGSSSAPSGGGVSFNLSLTTEHSGNYSCEADNGLGPQRSEAVPLNITVPTEDKKELLASEILEGLLGTLGPTIMALLLCYWLKKRIGRRPASDPCRSPPSPTPQVSNYINSAAPLQEQSVYENVNVISGEEVYSLVYHTQQERQAAVEPRRTHTTDQDASAIYFRLKKASVADVDYEDAM